MYTGAMAYGSTRAHTMDNEVRAEDDECFYFEGVR